jgi:uncharacterized protein YciI
LSAPTPIGRGAAAWLVGVAVLAATPYLVLGTGFVLDDWYTLRNAHFDGALRAAGSSQELARPGAALVYALTFGFVGEHPVVWIVLGASVSAGCALLLARIVSRFAGRYLGVAVATVWLITPNHTSLEAWASALNIGVALLLALVCVDRLAAGGRRHLVWAGLAAAAATLTYEAVAPVLAVAFVAIPWAARGRVDRRAVIAGLISIGATSGWIVANWHPDKHLAHQASDVSLLVPALLGWGIAPRGGIGSVALAVGLAGCLVAVVRLAFPSFRAQLGVGERLVLAGTAVAVLGVVPFILYAYAPLGPGDRALVVSAVGGALIWVGIGEMAWRERRPLAIAGAVALLVVAAAGRWERAENWSKAGEDADRILHAMLAAAPSPPKLVVIGPTPDSRDNVSAFLDTSNIQSAVQLRYDDPTVLAGIAADVAALAAAPGVHVDTRR